MANEKRSRDDVCIKCDNKALVPFTMHNTGAHNENANNGATTIVHFCGDRSCGGCVVVKPNVRRSRPASYPVHFELSKLKKFYLGLVFVLWARTSIRQSQIIGHVVGTYCYYFVQMGMPLGSGDTNHTTLLKRIGVGLVSSSESDKFNSIRISFISLSHQTSVDDLF